MMERNVVTGVHIIHRQYMTDISVSYLLRSAVHTVNLIPDGLHIFRKWNHFLFHEVDPRMNYVERLKKLGIQIDRE